MTTTLPYRGRRVAFHGWADHEGGIGHAETHAWIADGDTHADGIGFTETGTPFLVDADELRNPFPYDGCEACGWQYGEHVMLAYSKGQASIDENPTHLCQPGRARHDRALAESMARHPAGKRRPANSEYAVYALGHYEQMIVQKALLFVVDPTGRQGLGLSEVERQDLAGLTHIFNGFGTVTVTREDA
jgi:hypothetical protein